MTSTDNIYALATDYEKNILCCIESDPLTHPDAASVLCIEGKYTDLSVRMTIYMVLLQRLCEIEAISVAVHSLGNSRPDEEEEKDDSNISSREVLTLFVAEVSN